MVEGPRRPQYEYLEGTADSRKELLSTIYTPFQRLSRESAEYGSLAKSGKVWRDYFNPFDLEKERAWEEKNQNLLAFIQRQTLKLIPSLSSTIRSVLSHQSVQIEGYKLGIGDSNFIYNDLKEATDNFSNDVGAEEFSIKFAKKHPNVSIQQVEMFSSYVLAQESVLQMGNKPLQEADIKRLCKIVNPPATEGVSMVKLDGMRAFNIVGQYRNLPVSAHGCPHTIYPYPAEVPENMRLLVEQANQQFLHPTLHSITYALKFYQVFLHIHPFPDGNGRVGRLLLLLLLQKKGLVSPVFQKIDRDEYMNCLFLAAWGKPENYLRMMTWVMAEHLDILDPLVAV